MQELKFRCSQLGELMTNGRSKSEPLGETAKNAIIREYVLHKYGIKSIEHENKYFEKGNAVENQSLSLYSKVTGTIFIKNETRLTNDWIAGTPDSYNDDIVVDVKSSWDMLTFLKADMNARYMWQLQGYMWLTGAEYATLAYCLVDTPEFIQLSEKKRLYYRLGGDEMDAERQELYVKLSQQIDVNSKYSHIEPAKRLKMFRIQSDIAMINQLIERVELAREFVKTLNV